LRIFFSIFFCSHQENSIYAGASQKFASFVPLLKEKKSQLKTFY
jgi:hypothetical protein